MLVAMPNHASRPNLPSRAVGSMLDLVGVNDIVKHIDIDQILEHVDIQALIDRIDMNEVLARVDLQALLERIDLNEVVSKIDLDTLVKSTDLGAIIAQSTGGMASGAIDLLRRQGVGIDGVVTRGATQIRRHALADAPAGPPLLVAADEHATESAAGATADPTVDPSLIGHYAGAATRLGAFVLDVILAVGLFNVGVAGLAWLLKLFTRVNIPTNNHSGWWLVPLGAWLFLYFWYCWTLAGKTPGMALFGLRVVRGTGRDLDGSHAALRVLMLPVSWIPFGLGFAGIVIGRRHRALHDVIADTAVIYDFDARAARLRFLVSHPLPEAETAASPIGGDAAAAAP
jgi:uncharacterized RDD family membrane protein YckC